MSCRPLDVESFRNRARLPKGITRRKRGGYDESKKVSRTLLIRDTFQKVSQLGIENSASRLLPAGTVCLSRTASVGYAFVMGREMATSQDFVNWVCTPALLPKFLM